MRARRPRAAAQRGDRVEVGDGPASTTSSSSAKRPRQPSTRHLARRSSARTQTTRPSSSRPALRSSRSQIYRGLHRRGVDPRVRGALSCAAISIATRRWSSIIACRAATSRELFKAVLDDEARGVFQGKIIVSPGAQKTDGKQVAQALLLSDDGRVRLKSQSLRSSPTTWCAATARPRARSTRSCCSTSKPAAFPRTRPARCWSRPLSARRSSASSTRVCARPAQGVGRMARRQLRLTADSP